MLLHPEIYRDAFCYKPDTLSARFLESMFSVRRSPDGSNKAALESLVISQWQDFLQDSEEDPCKIDLAKFCFLQQA